MLSKIIMGIDASTTTVGIGILKYTQRSTKILYDGFYKPDKKNMLELDWLIATREHVLNLAKKYKVNEFAIEEYIKFMKGKSSASTILPLAILNRTLCLGIYDKYNTYPNILNILKIRHAIKLNKKLPSKEEVPEIIINKLGFNKLKYKKINKKTKKEEDMTEMFDVADALAVAYCHVIQQRKVK